MPLEQVPCSSPRPNSQRAHNTVCSLENYVFGRRSIPRPNFASVRVGQPKTDLFRRYRSPAMGLSGCARVSAQKPDVISRVTRAGTWREVLEFVRLPLPLLRVRRRRFFDRNIWPDSCVFRIQRQPFLKPGFAISLDGIDGAFRFANATVDAFVRMDDEHVLALVEAVHGAHLDAVHGFAANAAIVDDVGQLCVLPVDCRGQLMYGPLCSLVGRKWTHRRSTSSDSIGTPSSRHSGADELALARLQRVAPLRYTQSWQTPKRRRAPLAAK